MYPDEPYRKRNDPEAGKIIAERIQGIAESLGREINIMEVCGTHTVSLRQAGIHSLLPDNINLISGPGCPVCVTPGSYIDNAVGLVESGEAVVASFGDMLKVPDSKGKALSAYMGTGKVRTVYSPTELSEIVRETDKPVVFLGIGFETTIPGIASVFLKEHAQKTKNLYLYCAFKTVPQALKVLLSEKPRYIDGFLLPGHVSVIIGRKAYLFLESEEGVPGAIAGFEPVDMLLGIYSILLNISRKENRVENVYSRAVREEGNPKAREIMEELLKPVDALWRGLGVIPVSGMGLKREYKEMDAESVFGLSELTNKEPPGCLCSEVIQGKAKPPDCSLFNDGCTPEAPIGPCMVSFEGTCSAYLRYGDVKV